MRSTSTATGWVSSSCMGWGGGCRTSAPRHAGAQTLRDAGELMLVCQREGRAGIPDAKPAIPLRLPCFRTHAQRWVCKQGREKRVLP
eukprot:2164072-Rhodomonas_salina.3